MNSFHKIAGDAGHSRKKKITETVVMESAIAVKAESKQTGHQVLVFRQSNHTVSDVSRRQNMQFFSQPAGAASVIRYRHNDG